MKPSPPPPSALPLAHLRDIERMGEVTLNSSGTVAVRLRSGQVQLWRRVAGSTWLERVVP